jgi:hypothetical protein
MTAPVTQSAKRVAAAKRLILIPSSKGGVGKTTIARLIAEAHRAASTDAVLVDADSSVGQFAKHLGARDDVGALLNPQPISGGVQLLDWHADVRGRDALANVTTHGKPVVVDMPGGSLGTLRALDADADVMGVIIAAGFALTIVVSVTPYVETWLDASLVQSWLPTADLVLVANEGFGDDDDFADWRASETRASLLASPRTHEVVLARLEPRIAAAIARNRLAFRGAADSEKLAILDRGRARRWLAKVDDALAPIAKVLGLP